ncbi:hypothetical protein ABPG72_000845 [Tetrahymena utriculariae]
MKIQMQSESLKNSLNILKNIVDEINFQNSPGTLNSTNKMIQISKRLKMANILFQEECKEQKKFLKKYIRKSKSGGKNQQQNKQEKHYQQYQEDKNDNGLKNSNNQHNFKDKINNHSQPVDEEPPVAKDLKAEYSEKLSEDEIKEIIRQEFDIQKLREQYENSNRSDKFFENLCYTIHSVSKTICNQAEGIYNKVRYNFQKLLQEQDIITFQKSSQWFKNTIILFQIEQKKFTQLICLLKEEKNNFCLDLVKYDWSFQQQKNQINVMEKTTNNKSAFLYSHDFDDQKIIVQKFPSYQLNSKIGTIFLDYQDIIHFEVFDNQEDPDNLKSMLILTESKKLSLNTFKLSNLQILPFKKIFNEVSKLQFQPVQNCFATLSIDRKKIQIFDESGRNIYSLFQQNKYQILSFCFYLDNQALHIINFMNSFTVECIKIKINNQGQFLKQNLTKQIIQTDVYLESTKLPSEKDEPDIYFIKENSFYIQFQNRMYILYSNQVEIGILLYENKNYINSLFFENCIFRVYKNDITIQYYDQQNVYKEVSIFEEKIENFNLKQASITKISDKEYHFQIDIISTSDIYYTFYYNLDQ